MMDGLQFITATDNRQYYIESFLKSIIYGYQSLTASKLQYSRKTIHELIKNISKSDKAYNELEDYLCTELVNKHVKPNLHLFGLENFTVNVGVRETKESVTVGHLDIKFEVPSLGLTRYYAFEAKRIDKNLKKQKYYLSGGIKRFTNHKYYPETNTTVAGMLGFIEIESSRMGSRIEADKIKDALNSLIAKSAEILTVQPLIAIELKDAKYPEISSFKSVYLSKHTRDTDREELLIYHIFLDYYDILTS